LSFTPTQAALLLENSGLRLTPHQVEVLHRRTGGWAAGLRLAAVGMGKSVDHEAFLAQFSGDDRSVADYLVGEILAGLPTDLQDFLGVISICDPVPAALAAELSGRDDAGSVLDWLDQQTSLVSATGPGREVYRIQELLRTHLVADLQRRGLRRVAGLHAVSARWWAAQDQPLPALEHAGASHDQVLLIEMLHRFAIRLVLAGNHAPLRRAMASVGAEATADPWLLLASSLIHLEAGERAAAQGDLCRAQQLWPTDGGVDLAVLHGVVEQLGVGLACSSPSAIVDTDPVPSQPELEALVRLDRGNTYLQHDDRAAARAEFDAVLVLSRRHGFDYLRMECLALLGLVAGLCGDLRTMQTMSDAALVVAADRSWKGSRWSQAAAAMQGYSELLRCLPADAERRTTETLAAAPAAAAPEVRFALQAVRGAAVFDLGDRAQGLAQLQRARSDFGGNQAGAPLCAAMAMLEYRAALLLGHAAAARAVLSWLSQRSGDHAELTMMRAWADAAGGNHVHARGAIRAVLDGSTPALLPHTVIEGWLLETSIAIVAGERPAARHALQTALALAEPLDALRPFIQAGPNIRELMIHQCGSFGASEAFVNRVLTIGVGHQHQTAMLSEREITVLGLLPSMLSLEEIALDLTVSVNTVKSHIRSIYHQARSEQPPTRRAGRPRTAGSSLPACADRPRSDPPLSLNDGAHPRAQPCAAAKAHPRQPCIGCERPRPEENCILNPATRALAFDGELDNSVNCEPPRCAMTVFRLRSRLHRNTTD